MSVADPATVNKKSWHPANGRMDNLFEQIKDIEFDGGTVTIGKSEFMAIVKNVIDLSDLAIHHIKTIEDLKFKVEHHEHVPDGTSVIPMRSSHWTGDQDSKINILEKNKAELEELIINFR